MRHTPQGNAGASSQGTCARNVKGWSTKSAQNEAWIDNATPIPAIRPLRLADLCQDFALDRY
ncbi:hypothetical protein PsB1_2020 [Candidatus Phycosocius spiralis]|uniref:Uncharacterized protein n=1 Tax=Candidatus Phycosocius spiralis TaxID=2815099 RepID=A0ABQ4PY47_9PROT|nr:hypothetical protein PsB1_2020 [Candidatus Phycosocius spiralis]